MVSERKVRKLVAKAKNYDPKAFGKLYELYVKKIYRYIFFRVGNSHIAEDLTENVFYKALKSIDGFKFKKSVPFSSWLFTIASNILKNYYRHKEVEKKYLFENKVDISISNIDLPLIVEKEFKKKELIIAINKLNQVQRKVIIFKFISGLNNKEVSKIMKKSIGAVKALQYRALKNLSSYLSKEVS